MKTNEVNTDTHVLTLANTRAHKRAYAHTKIDERERGVDYRKICNADLSKKQAKERQETKTL